MLSIRSNRWHRLGDPVRLTCVTHGMLDFKTFLQPTELGIRSNLDDPLSDDRVRFGPRHLGLFCERFGATSRIPT